MLNAIGGDPSQQVKLFQPNNIIPNLMGAPERRDSLPERVALCLMEILPQTDIIATTSVIKISLFPPFRRPPGRIYLQQ